MDGARSLKSIMCLRACLKVKVIPQASGDGIEISDMLYVSSIHLHLVKEGIFGGITPDVNGNTFREGLNMVKPEGRDHQHVPWTKFRNHWMSTTQSKHTTVLSSHSIDPIQIMMRSLSCGGQKWLNSNSIKLLRVNQSKDCIQSLDRK